MSFIVRVDILRLRGAFRLVMRVARVVFTFVLKNQIVPVCSSAHFYRLTDFATRKLVNFMSVERINVVPSDKVEELDLTRGHGQHAQPAPDNLRVNSCDKLLAAKSHHLSLVRIFVFHHEIWESTVYLLKRLFDWDPPLKHVELKQILILAFSKRSFLFLYQGSANLKVETILFFSWNFSQYIHLNRHFILHQFFFFLEFFHLFLHTYWQFFRLLDPFPLFQKFVDPI